MKSVVGLNSCILLIAGCLSLLGTGLISKAEARPVNHNLSSFLHSGNSSRQKDQLDFIKNNGQWRAEIKYKTNINGGALFLTDKGFVYNFSDDADLRKADSLMEAGVSPDVTDTLKIHHYAYKVNFVGAQPSDDFEPAYKRSYYHNYFVGRDRSKWQGFVPLYGMVTQKAIYPGVDLAVYSKDKAPKYDFVVAPGVDPDVIQLGFEGISPELTKEGNIKLKTTFSEIQEKAPVAYQMIDGQRVDVPVKYKLHVNQVSFAFPGGYNASYPLIIDPQLVFCTYSGYGVGPGGGGNGFFAFGTTYDADGNTYIGTLAWQSGWPVTTGAFQTTTTASTFARDVAINKYNALGTNLIYSTYYGGSGDDFPNALRVNDQNELYVVGGTTSGDLPVTSGCADSILGGSMDIFIAHFNAAGSQLLGASFIGGSGVEPVAFMPDGSVSSLQAILTACPVEFNFDDLGNVWVVGNTASIDFPVTANAQQANTNGGPTDGVIVKLPPDCSQYLYSSYYGGSGADGIYGIDFNSNDDPVICGFTSSVDFPATDSVLYQNSQGGQDGFVSILDHNTGAIKKSTYLGTTNQDVALQVVVAPGDEIYVMGVCSGNYPTSNGVYSVPSGNTFIEELSAGLDNSLASTVVGGNGYYPDGFMVDICSNVYVTGLGAPVGLPLTTDAFQSIAAPFWFVVLKPHFSDLLYATYFGTTDDHNHCSISRIDPNGIVYHSICNNTATYFNVTPGCWAPNHGQGGQDVITFKFDFQATGVQSHIDAPSGGKDTIGCAPYTLNLGNASTAPYSMTYTWDAGDGSPVIHTTDFTHTYDSVGIYTVVLHAHSDSACIQDDYDSFVVQIVKVSPPQITSSSDTVICSMENSIPLWVHTENQSPNTSIEWLPANGVLSGGTSDTVLVNPAIPTYYVRVTDSIAGLCGFSIVDTIHIDLFPRALKINTNDTTVCKGTQLQIDAESAQGYSFLWSPADDVSDSTALNPVITANESQIYTLTAHHPGCTDTARILSVNVEDLPIVNAGDNIDICQWQQVALSANVTPYRNDYAYQWTPAEALNHPDNPNTYFTADSSGWYYLNVTTPTGCTGRDSVYVTVFPGNFGAVIQDTGYCPSHEVQLWAAGGNHYHWTPAYGLSDTTIADPLARPASTTNYTVYMEDVHGCRDTGNVSVVVYPSAVLTLPDSISVYPGESYHLQPGTNCLYFDWFPTNGINVTTISDPIFSPAVRTRYFVTARTESGCVVSDSMDVLVKGTVINMANAFTPGSGINGTYKVSKRGIARLKEFSIYNRWGNKVFSTTDINQGWDGSFNGKPQPIGVYVYTVEAITDSGQTVSMQGNVTLIR